MKKSALSRSLILARGLEMTSERGLAGVSLGGLAERAGMSKSGLFAHFRSKEELQVELLRAAEEVLRRDVVAPAMEVSEGLPRLRVVVGRWFGWAERSGLPGGCPLFGAVFELDDAEGPARDYLVESHKAWTGLLRQLVRDASALGQLREDLDVAQFVWQLTGIYLSHHVSWRLTRDPDADTRASVAFEALVTSAQPDHDTDRRRDRDLKPLGGESQ